LPLKPFQTIAATKFSDVLYRIGGFRAVLADADEFEHRFRPLSLVGGGQFGLPI
jgi:hypothetical protein